MPVRTHTEQAGLATLPAFVQILLLPLPRYYPLPSMRWRTARTPLHAHAFAGERLPGAPPHAARTRPAPAHLAPHLCCRFAHAPWAGFLGSTPGFFPSLFSRTLHRFALPGAPAIAALPIVPLRLHFVSITLFYRSCYDSHNVLTYQRDAAANVVTFCVPPSHRTVTYSLPTHHHLPSPPITFKRCWHFLGGLLRSW